MADGSRYDSGSTQQARVGLRIAALAGLIALLLAVAPTGAAGAVTVGQLAPGDDPPLRCLNPDPYDMVQPSVTSGNSFAFPNGVLTSWSHNAGVGSLQTLDMKVFRRVPGTANDYQLIAHDGPRNITSGALNTYSGHNIPVQTDDLLGFNVGTADNACVFNVPGETRFERLGDLAVDQQGTFNPVSDFRLNITAQVNPTNTITLGQIERNKKKG